ncbi:MAG: TIGR02679 family protein [Betaproteobacteria bacterium RIFCSPLOWO2_12_FULL_62_13]|nr:MAG: TIGR02679 family protein [Betaproteobacteria bacterium RIFCSPLOWO2_12_FULL_62_13]
MSDARQRLERLLGGPALAGLRARLRQRYELGRRNDAFTLTRISIEERHALEGLLGRQTRNSRSIQLSVAALDRALARAGLADSLSDAIERLDGPIRNRVAEREQLSARWESVFAAVKRAPLAALISDAAGRGLVKRLAGSDPDSGERLLDGVMRVLERLPQQGVPLSRLAADALVDAHALDEGRPIGTLVLAALRGAEDAERARDVWAKCGVLMGELSAPAIALNLPAADESPGGRLAQSARAMGEPIHFSLRLLLRTPPQWDVRSRVVFVCENPAVVAIAADRLGKGAAPIVCTDGMPSAAQRVLLTQLATAGAALRYHGDFDWAGIAIGNFVMKSFAAKPWRFAEDDYASHATHAGRRLTDAPVIADWDAGLSRRMRECGYALEEETVIDALLEDLATPS